MVNASDWKSDYGGSSPSLPTKHNSQMNSYFAFLWKERVVGSSPTPGAILFFNARIAQMVEKNYLFIVFFMLYILLEIWQSGRLHRSWKPEAVNSGPGVRIPQSPHYNFRVVAQWPKALDLGSRLRRFESCLPYEGKYLKHTEVRWNIDTRKLNVWARFKSFHEFLRIVFIFYLQILHDS